MMYHEKGLGPLSLDSIHSKVDGNCSKMENMKALKLSLRIGVCMFYNFPSINMTVAQFSTDRYLTD